MKIFRKWIAIIMIAVFGMTGLVPSVQAQGVFLPPAEQMVVLSSAYQPCLLRGVKVDSGNLFHMDFIVDEGDSSFTPTAFKDESQKIIKYFLASLTVPEEDLWVNLSPYEDNRIIPDGFGRTLMGRDLLAEDYLLKQITSSLMHPDSDLGKKFWDEVYHRTYEKFGTTDIPVDSFNKVWIVPEHAVVYENEDEEKMLSAFVENAKLKVMLESDYLAAQKSAVNRQQSAGHSRLTTDHLQSQPISLTQELSKQVLKDVIIPVLEKEVNEGRNFAQLRQVYYSLLLAAWLKEKISSAAVVPMGDVSPDRHPAGNILSRIFINRNKTAGVETQNPGGQISTIYDRYVEAFHKGVYNLIREDRDLYSEELIPRKYFSGGVGFENAVQRTEIKKGGLPSSRLDRAQGVSVDLAMSVSSEEPGATVRSAIPLDVAMGRRVVRQIAGELVTGVSSDFAQSSYQWRPYGRRGRTRLRGFPRFLAVTCLIALPVLTAWGIRGKFSRDASPVEGGEKNPSLTLSGSRSIEPVPGEPLGVPQVSLNESDVPPVGGGSTEVSPKKWAPVVIDLSFFQEVAKRINKYEGNKGLTGSKIKKRLFSNKVKFDLMGEEITEWFEEEAGLQRLFSTPKEFALAMFVICYNESSLGWGKGPVWHVLPRTRQHLLDIFSGHEELSNTRGDSFRWALANAAYNARMISGFYPKADKGVAQAIFFAAYNYGQQGVYFMLPEGNFFLVIVQGVLTDTVDSITSEGLTPNATKAARRAGRYSLKACQIMGLDLNGISSSDLMEETGFLVVPEGFELRLASSNLRGSKDKVAKHLGVPEDNIQFLAGVSSIEPGNPYFYKDNSQAPQDLGGIDLNTKNLDLLLKGHAGNMEFRITPEQMKMIDQNFNGFTPVIINVQPVADVPMFLGLGVKKGQDAG